MYRQGFGDCLLVELPAESATPFRILIDCGVLLGTPDAVGRMRQVVEDLIAHTDGRIDVLAVTHEHWDHVSGFVQVPELFAGKDAVEAAGKLSFGELWLAWTEDPADRVAALLRAERESRLSALFGLVEGLRAAGPAAALPLAGGIANLLGFFGLSANSTADALEAARALAPERYLRPADPPWQCDGVPGVRIYVLGPPPDPAMIRRLSAAGELYREFAPTFQAQAFFAAVHARLGIGARAGDEEARYVPFDRTEWLPLDGEGFGEAVAKARDEAEVAVYRGFFEQHYWGSAGEENDHGWRRIDHDWLGAATELALQLDAATNNTSLVLAIELVQSRKVLLLAGDAQVGNWLSWHDLEWTLDEGETVTASRLLERTVFYKVSHHGSHNATLKDKGLELMRSDDFVAFVPVDEATARRRNWNRIPFPPLMEALQKDGRRAIRSDLGAGEPTDDDPLVDRLRETELYVEYTVRL